MLEPKAAEIATLNPLTLNINLVPGEEVDDDKRSPGLPQGQQPDAT